MILCHKYYNLLMSLFFIWILIIPINLSANNQTASLKSRPNISSERKGIDESKVIIENIKSNEPFVNVEKNRLWRYKDEAEKTEGEIKEESVKVPDLIWLTGLVYIVSVIIEFIFWMVPLFLALYLYRHRKYWMALIEKKELTQDAVVLPETLFGLDVRRDQLPDNIESYSQKLWRNNQKRDAVSLLYRGALVFLFDSYRFSLPSGATEQDCIRYLESYKNSDRALSGDEKIKQQNQQRLMQFQCISHIWINLAYAHQLPNDDEFNGIAQRWNSFFTLPEQNI